MNQSPQYRRQRRDRSRRRRRGNKATSACLLLAPFDRWREGRRRDR